MQSFHAMSCFVRHFCDDFWFAAHRWPGCIRHTHHRHRRRTVVVDIAGHRHGLRQWFVTHTRRLEHIGPFAARPCVAVLEMLTEVIGAIKLLCLVAFAELVCPEDMVASMVPVCWVGELFTTVATDVCCSICGRRCVEDCLNCIESGTRPRMTA